MVDGVFVDSVIGHKVDAGRIGRDGAAVDQVRHGVAQHMRCGVQAHQPVAALPIEGGDDRIAHGQRVGAAFGAQVHDEGQRAAVVGFGLAGVDHGQHAAVGGAQLAGVARLAAAQWVEHGAVQHYALLGQCHHGGGAAAQVAVIAKQCLGRGQLGKGVGHGF